MRTTLGLVLLVVLGLVSAPPLAAAPARPDPDGVRQSVRVLKDLLTTYGADRKLKQKAYAALGALGTKEAIDAVTEFETWAQNKAANPPPFQFGRFDWGIDHYQQERLEPLAEFAAADGTKWAMFRWARLGRGLWLAKRLDERSWWPSIFLSGFTEPAHQSPLGLKIEGGTAVIIADGVETRLDLNERTADSDEDGLSDVIEEALGTNARDHDTDRDGVLDGGDRNPMTPAVAKLNDTQRIRLAVFRALFATCNSRHTLVLVGDGDFTKQEYKGYAGWIVRSPKIRDGFINITGIDVKIESPDSATATIHDYEGDLAASTHEAKLKRVFGRWVVTIFRMTEVA